MKTALVILISGLFLFSTPVFAQAHGGARDAGAKQQKSWEKARHERGYKWERQARRQHKQHYREHRRMKRHHRQPYYAAPVVVYGVPRIIFHLDW